MSTAGELTRLARRRAGTTQAAHARLAGTSRTRFSTYEHGTVEPSVGTMVRILDPAGLELVAVPKMTPEDRRSLGFGTAIAAHLRSERSEEIMTRARVTLARIIGIDRESGGHSQPLLRIWENLLDMGATTCASVLEGHDDLAQELRSAAPFGGVLTDEERLAVIRATR